MREMMPIGPPQEENDAMLAEGYASDSGLFHESYRRVVAEAERVIPSR